MKIKTKTEHRIMRHKRVRARVKGTKKCPRFSIYKSNRFLYAQLIDDDSSNTLVQANSREMKGKDGKEKADALGATIAERAKAAKIKEVVFDRGGFLFSGNIKRVADSARKSGLKF